MRDFGGTTKQSMAWLLHATVNRQARAEGDTASRDARRVAIRPALENAQHPRNLDGGSGSARQHQRRDARAFGAHRVEALHQTRYGIGHNRRIEASEAGRVASVGQCGTVSKTPYNLVHTAHILRYETAGKR